MTADVDLGLCQCCNDEPAIGVASIPYIPMSIAWGRRCLQARAIPMWAAVANTAICGGLEHCNEGWTEGVVAPTLEYFGVSVENFNAQVEQAIREEAERAEREQP